MQLIPDFYLPGHTYVWAYSQVMTEVGESLWYVHTSTQTMHTYNRLISSGGYLLRGSLVTSCSWCIRCSINNLCSMYTSKASLCTTYEQMSFRWVSLKIAYGKAGMDSDNCVIKLFYWHLHLFLCTVEEVLPLHQQTVLGTVYCFRWLPPQVLDRDPWYHPDQFLTELVLCVQYGPVK